MFRVGIGHDTHRFLPDSPESEARPLRLGGVTIPYRRALAGHSDADVLLHALSDALLGAAGMGDIGEIFPDTAEENRNRDSGEMLALIAERVQGAGWRIQNADLILFAEAPKLLPYKSTIRRRIAELLKLAENQVNIKAKTGEKIGIIGRQEAICAEAAVLIEQ